MSAVVDTPRIADGSMRPFAVSLRAEMPRSWKRTVLLAVLPIAALVVMQWLSFEYSEPVFYGDENRHVMTSIFFRDLLADRPLTDVRGYAERYYVQYPALGLLIWPPLFHALTGAVMLVAGTSSVVATLMVALSAAIACVFLFRLVSRTHDQPTAAVVVLLFGTCPLVFEYSRHVMLEMPTLMWGLIATFHFVRFLDESRRRDVLIAAIASACAALTRFDAVYLLPLFGILLAARGEWRVLKRWDVWASAAVALLLVLPYYALVAKEIGGLHLRQASESVRPGDSTFLAAQNFLFYPRRWPAQVGWCVTLFALLGLFRLTRAEDRRRIWPYFAIILATYLTFTPLAELDSRHAIYWIPGIVLLAIEGMGLTLLPVRFARRAGVPVMLLLVLPTSTLSLTWDRPTVRGYEQAARFVLENSAESDGNVCLFDGWLDGNFTYHMRHLDPQRRFGVLRGDKLFYGFVCVPGTDYTEYTKTDRDMLDMLGRYAPKYIVVEEPQIEHSIPAAQRFRELLYQHPERFRVEKTIPIHSGSFAGDYELRVYRNLARDESARSERPVEFEVLGLGRAVRSQSAPKKAQP
jgi:hypothetical protein